MTPGDVHVVLYRDPVPRYMSCFRSKIMCCPNNSSEPCHDDKANRFADDLVRLLNQLSGPALEQSRAGAVIPCMHLDEFLKSLLAVRSMGHESQVTIFIVVSLGFLRVARHLATFHHRHLSRHGLVVVFQPSPRAHLRSNHHSKH